MSRLTIVTRAVLSSWLVAIWKRRLKSSILELLAKLFVRELLNVPILHLLCLPVLLGAGDDLRLDGKLMLSETQGLLGR